MSRLILMAGLASTALFVVSYLPMLHRAWRTRDLASYSRPSLVLANVGNAVYAIYVYSLPIGPIWFLHGFYLAASAFMLGLHVRHITTDSGRADDWPQRPASSRPREHTTELTTSSRSTS